MRVRTAVTELHRATSLKPLFDQAVDRNVAWIIGTGHVYADLASVARSHGYRLWVEQVPEGEDANFWVAVRENLVVDVSWSEEPDHIIFDSAREYLGTVSIGRNDDANENHLNFYYNGDGSVTTENGDDRIRSMWPAPKVEGKDYDYTEILYGISGLAN